MKTSQYIFVAVAICLLSPSRLLAQEAPADSSTDAVQPNTEQPNTEQTDTAPAKAQTEEKTETAKSAEAAPAESTKPQEAKNASTAAAPAPASKHSSSGPSSSGTSQQIKKLDRTTRAILHKSAMGLQLGEATGINLAYDIDKRQQLSAVIGFSPVYRSVVTHLDYLYHFYSWVPDGDYGVALSLFAGGGLRLGFFEPRPSYLREIPFAMGGRVPFGIVASMPPLPMELVLSAAPGFDLSPELRFHGEASLAVRFFLDPKRRP